MSAKGKCLVVGDVDQRYLDRLTQAGYEIVHKSEQYELDGKMFEACIIDEYLTGTTAQREINLANAQLLGNDYWREVWKNIFPPFPSITLEDKQPKLKKLGKKPHTQPFWTNNWRKK